MNDYSFGNYLYKLRTNAGLSQSELASELSITSKAISKWNKEANEPHPYH